MTLRADESAIWFPSVVGSMASGSVAKDSAGTLKNVMPCTLCSQLEMAVGPLSSPLSEIDEGDNIGNGGIGVVRKTESSASFESI